MSRFWLFVLVILIAVAGGLAWFVQKHFGGKKDLGIGRLIAPQIASNIGNLHTVSIVDGQGQALEIVLTDDEWGVVSKDNYPADFSRLSDLVSALAELSIQEIKSTRPENHEHFGLLLPGEADGVDGGADSDEARGTLVTLAHEDGREIFSVLLGKAAERANHQYARLPDSNQVWLVRPQVSVATTAPLNWLARPIVDIDPAQVKSVVFEEDGERKSLYRKEGVDGLVFDPPEGYRIAKDSDLQAPARILQELSFLDLSGASGDFEAERLASVTTFDGIVLNLRAAPAEVEGTFLLTIDFDLAEEALFEEAADQLERWKKNYTGRVYLVADTVYNRLGFDLAGFIEPAEDEEEEQAEGEEGEEDDGEQ